MISRVACWEMFKHTDGDSDTGSLAGTSLRLRAGKQWRGLVAGMWTGAGGGGARAVSSCSPPGLDDPLKGDMDLGLPEPTLTSFT